MPNSVIQQILCWMMVRASCDYYACIQDQYPCPWLLFDNILFEMKNWSKRLVYFIRIRHFPLLPLMLKVLHKYSHNICKIFWRVKMKICIFEKTSKINSHKTVSQWTQKNEKNLSRNIIQRLNCGSGYFNGKMNWNWLY